jgi:hypothetical protein
LSAWRRFTRERYWILPRRTIVACAASGTARD